MALPDIPSAANDVDALADALAGPGPDRSDVETLRNPSLGEVRQALGSALAAASRDTTLLVHFACHGIVDHTGRSFLALADTDPEHPAATAIETDSMMELMQRGNAGSVVVVLNACMTGNVRPTPRFGPDLHDVVGAENLIRPGHSHLHDRCGSRRWRRGTSRLDRDVPSASSTARR
jgi:hypothetical protein